MSMFLSERNIRRIGGHQVQYRWERLESFSHQIGN